MKKKARYPIPRTRQCGAQSCVSFCRLVFSFYVLYNDGSRRKREIQCEWIPDPPRKKTSRIAWGKREKQHALGSDL